MKLIWAQSPRSTYDRQRSIVSWFRERPRCAKYDHNYITLIDASCCVDGSTDRRCIAIVTNDRALLSGSDQPVQNLGRHRILCM